MNIIPFESAKAPTTLAAAFSVSFDEFASGQKIGFPVISIKSKVFHIKRGEETTLVTKPDAPDEPAAHIEVVVLKTHAGLAKTYYTKGYTEGAAEKPDCYSNDGVAPAADAQEPQAKKCATCVHNQWGSRITDDGKKAKSCQDVKRVAVAAAGQLNDPMLLRIPPTSLKAWDAFIDLLKKRNAPPPTIVTKIGFDYTVAHPALTFKPVGFLPESALSAVMETLAQSVVQDIVGGVGAPAVVEEDAPAASTAEAAPAAPAKPAGKTKPKTTTLAAAVDTAEQEPAKTVPVESAAEAPPTKPAKTVMDIDSLTAEIDDELAALGFDDE